MGAFVTRRKDPEGAEIVGTRRFRGRINAVAVGKSNAGISMLQTP